MKRNQIIATLVSVGHKERTLQNKSNDALRKLMNLGNKKIAKIREEKARQEAEFAVRMGLRAEQQKAEARREAVRLERVALRLKREAEEAAPIKRFIKRGFTPLPPIGVPTSASQTLRQRIAALDAKVEETKLALRNNRWTKELADAAALAVLERKCFIEDLPEADQQKIRAEEYVQRTARPLFGSHK